MFHKLRNKLILEEEMYHKITEEVERRQAKWPWLKHNKIDVHFSKSNEWRQIICHRDQEPLDNLNQNDHQGQLIIQRKSQDRYQILGKKKQ